MVQDDPDGGAEAAANAELDTIIESAMADTPAAPVEDKSAPAPAATPDTSSAPQPRDKEGRFTAPDAAAEPADTTSPEAPAAPSDASPSPDALAQAEAPKVEYPAYTFRSNGQDVTIPGSAVGKDGAFVPTDQLPFVSRLLSEGHHARQASRDYARRLDEARSANREEVEQAQALVAELDALFSGDEQQLYDWMESAKGNWQLLRAKAEADVFKTRAKRIDEERAALEQERRQQALMPVMQQELKSYVQRFQQDARFKGLNIDWSKLETRLWARDRERIFRPPTTEEVERGFDSAEPVVDWGIIADEVEYVASFAPPRTVPTPKPTPAKPTPTPPTVSTKGGPPAGKSEKVPEFASAREADDYYFSR